MTRLHVGARCAVAALALALGAALGPSAAAPPAKKPPVTPAAVAPPKILPTDLQLATIPGFPDARFWADSAEDFLAVMPQAQGAWLALSSGGGDGAYGAGLLAGWTQSGKRPIFSLVTGVSTGALMAPYAFAGPKWDAALRESFTALTAADVFEVGSTPESLVDTWPLKELIERRVTPDLLADIATAHKAGRRLFVVTTSLDAGRPVAWNLGAIATVGGAKALALFRDVLLASSSIPGVFPPVRIEVETGGKRFQETHVDGAVTGPFYVAPAEVLATPGLPTDGLYLVLNGKFVPGLEIPDRSTAAILGRSIAIAMMAGARMQSASLYQVSLRTGLDFNLAFIPASFAHTAKGMFDPAYMGALYALGLEQGRMGAGFHKTPPSVLGTPPKAERAALGRVEQVVER